MYGLNNHIDGCRSLAPRGISVGRAVLGLEVDSSGSPDSEPSGCSSVLLDGGGGVCMSCESGGGVCM